MKKILLAFCIAAAVSLSGCVTTQVYDNNQFEMLVRFSVATEELKAQCDKESGDSVKAMLPELRRQARVIRLYTEYTPRDKEAFIVARILENDIEELQARYGSKPHNKFYCNQKAKLINMKAKRIMEAVGKKRR